MDYPYTLVLGNGAEDPVRISLRIEDEYHRIDETDLLAAVRDYLLGVPYVTSVSAEQYDVHVTPVPGV